MVETTYTRVVERIGLTDHRKAEEQIDALLRSRPDLIVLTGGTDGGASRSIQKMLDAVGLACYLMPPEKRPAVLFAGNASLTEDVKTLMSDLTPALHISSNVRPALETEDIDPAMSELAHIFTAIRRGQLRGVDELDGWSNGHILPSSYAAGRMIRFLSAGGGGGVLGVDLGTSGASISAGVNGKFSLRTYPQFGLGENLAALLQAVDINQFMRWLSLDLDENTVRDYLYQKSLRPSILPVTPEDRVISQAVARQALYMAMRAASKDFPATSRSLRPDLLPLFELILVSGASLTDGPTPGQNMLLLLDAIQPVGITRFLLDRNNLLPLLGVAAEQNSLLPVQVIESGAFHNLAWTVSVVSNAPYGTPVLQARLQYPDKNEARIEVKHGSLEVLPLSLGQVGRLTIQPLHRSDIGFGHGRPHTTMIEGGALGVVIDARGRPLQLPSDAVRRRDIFKKWLWTLGG